VGETGGKVLGRGGEGKGEGNNEVMGYWERDGEGKMCGKRIKVDEVLALEMIATWRLTAGLEGGVGGFGCGFVEEGMGGIRGLPEKW
jgi:hypothetical protein